MTYMDPESKKSHKLGLKKHGFTRTISVEEAHRRIQESIKMVPLPTEILLTERALGRCLGEILYSKVDIPPWDKSAVDGYAVQNQDTNGASITNPRTLKITSTIQIEENPQTYSIQSGEAIWVPTGGGVPNGSNAVIMMEDTEKIDESHLDILSAIPAGANISPRGEDVQKNQQLLPKYRRLAPPDLGLLLSAGYEVIPVIQKPKVAILAIGNELVPSKDDLTTPFTRETNRTILGGYVTQFGGEYIDLGIAPDDPIQITSTLKAAIPKYDIICTSGGTSVGTHDYSVEVASTLGKCLFHGVALSPGMPIAVTNVTKTLLFSLSGFTVATIVEFLVFVVPMIQQLLGQGNLQPYPLQEATLTRRIPSRLGRLTFVRLHVYKKPNDPKIYADPVRTKGSGVLSSLTRANGFLLLPPNVEGLSQGSILSVSLLNAVHINTESNQ